MNNDQCAAIIKAIEAADIAAFSATMDDLINNLPDENP